MEGNVGAIPRLTMFETSSAFEHVGNSKLVILSSRLRHWHFYTVYSGNHPITCLIKAYAHIRDVIIRVSRIHITVAVFVAASLITYNPPVLPLLRRA